MKTSRWNRYDTKTGLWIQSSKPIFTFWYKFLQIATKEKRDIQWDSYLDWGDAELIKETKFDAWWKDNWKDLFGYKLGNTEPKYPLSQKKPQLDGIKYSLLVYELKKEKPNEDYWNLAKEIAAKEYPRRRDKGRRDPNFKPEYWSFNIARPVITRELIRKDRREFAKHKRVLSSRMGRYFKSAETHLENVCVGKFP
tara:strand:+ start:33 stop:620 length:588 start_codon:yes stop_codon:yes gene_type:complete